MKNKRITVTIAGIVIIVLLITIFAIVVKNAETKNSSKDEVKVMETNTDTKVEGSYENKNEVKQEAEKDLQATSITNNDNIGKETEITPKPTEQNNESASKSNSSSNSVVVENNKPVSNQKDTTGNGGNLETTTKTKQSTGETQNSTPVQKTVEQPKPQPQPQSQKPVEQPKSQPTKTYTGSQVQQKLYGLGFTQDGGSVWIYVNIVDTKTQIFMQFFLKHLQTVEESYNRYCYESFFCCTRILYIQI